MNSHEVFIHIHQDCFAGTGAIVRLPQCQWSKPDGYGQISQCITTTKQKPCAYFLGYTVVWNDKYTVQIYATVSATTHLPMMFTMMFGPLRIKDWTCYGTSLYCVNNPNYSVGVLTAGPFDWLSLRWFWGCGLTTWILDTQGKSWNWRNSVNIPLWGRGTEKIKSKYTPPSTSLSVGVVNATLQCMLLVWVHGTMI